MPNERGLLVMVRSKHAAPPRQFPEIYWRRAPAKPTVVFDSYWRFAAERQEIFFKRLCGACEPWTADPIIESYKFTNSYRASDRVSQFLIRNVIYNKDLPDDPVEVFFRIILFKVFNKIETWKMLEQRVGPITFEDYSFEHYNSILEYALNSGTRIYSAAYIMPPGGNAFGQRLKHQNHLRLIERLMADEVALRLSELRLMSEAFKLLASYPTIGKFLAYQFVTDINYSRITDFSEAEFVVPGPGARDGILKCFSTLGDLSESDIVRLMVDNQSVEFARLGLPFRSLFGRPLQLVDCQNVFCEIDKYARVAHPDYCGKTGRKRIKQKFVPSSKPINYWYPPKWGLNGIIAEFRGRQ
jgi:hypothetical protein